MTVVSDQTCACTYIFYRDMLLFCCAVLCIINESIKF